MEDIDYYHEPQAHHQYIFQLKNFIFHSMLKSFLLELQFISMRPSNDKGACIRGSEAIFLNYTLESRIIPLADSAKLHGWGIP